MTARHISQTMTNHELSCDGYMDGASIKCYKRYAGGINYPLHDLCVDATEAGWRCDDSGDWCPNHKELPTSPIPDISDIVEQTQRNYLAKRFDHIAMLSAAYLARTDLDPRDVTLVQKHEGLITRWWFEPKATTDAR